MPSPTHPDATNRKALFGWVMYDWANSAFALTVLTTFFPVFFKQYWCAGIDQTISTARLGVANSIAGVLVMILSPLLGAFADTGNNRKRFLAASMLTGVLATGLLAGVGQGAWMVAVAIFILANIGFECSILFYDSLLPQIATEKRMDFVSSLGYSAGYLGCAILFIGNILMISKPHLFGLENAGQAIRWSFVSVAVWWLIFSMPLFLFVKERGAPDPGASDAPVRKSFRRLGQTLRSIIRTPHIALFLIAYWLYIDGVHTFIRMASDFGLSIGLPAAALMKAILIVQLVAFPSALLFGWLAQRAGTLPSILAGITLYIFICLGGPILVTTPGRYTFFAVLSGIPLGCLQALSRSYYARMIPAGRSAEYFGFYSLLGKAAVIIGPLMVGVVAILFRHAGASAAMSARWGMGSIVVLFAAGGALLVAAEQARRTHSRA
jgi:UMF1 family MFS transporter